MPNGHVAQRLAVRRYKEMGWNKRANGLEPSTFSLEGCNTSVVSGDTATSYESSASRLVDSLADSLRNDPDFAAVITAWPKLPQAVKAGIVAIVKATQTNESA